MAEKAEIVLSGRDLTAAAFSSAKRNLDSLQGSAVGIAGRLGAIGAAATAAVVALDRFNPKAIIDTADEFNKLSQRTGVAVENLSAMNYAAKLADVSTEDLTSNLKKLNLNIAAAARGEAEQAAAFKAIGVSVVDASGKVRSADKVFEDLADRFAQYEDGPNKVALANAVGGKSFEQLIPLLNGGKQGLIDARQEAEKFGIVLSGDLAKKSEIFNDNLTRLAAASDALKVSIAGGLIDNLVSLSTRLVEAAKSGNLFLGVLNELNNISPAGAAGGKFATELLTNRTELEKASESARHFNKVLEATQKLLAADPSNQALQSKLDDVKKKLDTARAAVAGLTPRTDAAGASFRAGLKSTGAAFAGDPKPAPPLPKTGGGTDNAEALLRKQLEGRLKTIQATLERERDLFAFSDAQLAEQFAHGELSIAAFYDKKNQIQLDSLAAQSRAGADEVALFKEFQAKLTKPADKADLGNRQVEAIERQAKAFREAGQSATVSEQARVRATEEFQRSLADLDAQLAELSGNKYGAELLRNAQTLAAARDMLAKGGGDTNRENALRSRLDAQASFNALQEKSARISEQAQADEEGFLIKAARLGLNRNQVEVQLGVLRSKSLDDMDALIAATERLLTVSEDPNLIVFYERAKLARERAFDAKDPALLRFNQLATDTGKTMADSFEEAVFSGKKLSDVIKDLTAQLAKMAFNELITKQLAESLSNTFKGSGGSGDSIGGWLGTLGSIFGGSYNGNYSNEGRNYPASATASPSSAGGAARTVLPLSTRASTYRATPAQGGDVYITNNSPAQVSTERDRNGDLQVLIAQIVDQTHSQVAADVGSGTGRVSTAMKARGVNLNGGIPRRT
jgi:hypothetical protein